MLIIIIVVLVFIATEGLRYSLNQKEVDLLNYHLNVENPVKYLTNEKYIVTYDRLEHSLNRIGHIASSNGKVLAESDKIYIPRKNLTNDTAWIQYTQELKRLNCDSQNLENCIEKNFLKPQSYIVNNNSKAYLLDKLFALKLYEIVLKYSEYLKSKKS
jgi:hypothetical protein